jgi:general secretion pathway protein B
MSSILKALKRLEQQKAVRRDADHDVAWIVHYGGSQPDEKRRWPLAAALVAVASVSVVSTYWLMRGGHTDGAAGLTPSTGLQRKSAENAPATGTVQREPTRGETTGEPSPVRETGKSPSVPAASSRVPASSRGTAAGNPTLDSDLEPVEMAAVPRREEARRAAKPGAVQRSAEPAASRPPSSHSTQNLKVTGIAWQNDGQEHIAIVNGVSVSEGSRVEGARVEKIFPDRVRFSAENGSFEVPLGKGSEGK